MPKDITFNLKPALNPEFPTIFAFNRHMVTRAGSFIVATCGLVSDNGELLSSYSFSLNPMAFADNRESIVRYLTRLKDIPPRPDNINKGIRIPQGGVVISNSSMLNAGTSQGFSEIRLEDYSSSMLRAAAKSPSSDDADDSSQDVDLQPVALLRSDFVCHYYLLADIYLND